MMIAKLAKINLTQHFKFYSILKSVEFTIFWLVSSNYSNYVQVNMPEWPNGPCCFKIEFQIGILEIKSLKKAGTHDSMTLCYEVTILSHIG